MTGDREDQWLEIRMKPNREFEQGNARSIINHVTQADENCEILLANTSHPKDQYAGDKIRFFCRAQTPATQRALKRKFEAEGLFVTTKDQPSLREYSREVELEAADEHTEPSFAVPSEEEWERKALLDISKGLWGELVGGGAVRVTFKFDERAKDALLKKARWLERGRPPSGWQQFISEIAEAILSLGEKSQKREPPQSKREPNEDDLAEARELRNRASGGMYTLDVRIYGANSRVNSILQSLPFTRNRFKEYRSRKLSELREGDDESRTDHRFTPSRGWITRKIRKAIIALPFALLLPLIYSGLWKPWTTGLFSASTYALPIVLGIVSTYTYLAWKRQEPIVLSKPELNFLISFPQQLMGLPLLGTPAAPPESQTAKGGGEID